MQTRKVEAGLAQRVAIGMANFATGDAHGFIDAALQDHTTGHTDLATGATQYGSTGRVNRPAGVSEDVQQQGTDGGCMVVISRPC